MLGLLLDDLAQLGHRLVALLQGEIALNQLRQRLDSVRCVVEC